MAEGKKTFVFYSDWINMVRELDDEDAGGLLKHVLAYVNDENPSTDNKIVKVVFAHMKPILKADLKKWESIREIRQELGRKGGQANAKQKLANAKQRQAVNVNVNVSSKEDGKSPKDFNKPIKDLYNEFVREVKNGEHEGSVQRWYMQLRIRNGSLQTLLEDFQGQLLDEKKLHKNTLEFKTHFKRWLDKLDSIGKLNDFKK